jgi:hypothetical protein
MSKQVFSTGFLFPLTHVVAGIIFFIGGLLLIIFKDDTNLIGFIMGFPLVIGGGVWSLCFKGGIVDYDSKKIKPFFSFLGIRFGFWKSIADCPCICMLQHGNSETLDSPINESVDPSRSFSPRTFEFSRYFNTYEICFLSSNHFKKLPFVSSYKKENIQTIINVVSKNLNIPIVTYNPDFSARSKRR